jgi:hypothetical protein
MKSYVKKWAGFMWHRIESRGFNEPSRVIEGRKFLE